MSTASWAICTEKPAPDLFAPYAQHAGDDPAWRFRAFPGDYMAMLSMPEELAALLLEVV